jgi:hypothetical protein
MDAQAKEAVIGDNNPPEPTPFEKVSERIDDLWTEAKNWLDGSKVTTETEASAVSKLLDDFRKAEKEADEARKDEVKPYDEAKAAVQAKYAPLIADTKAVKGRTVIAIDACKKALAPYLAAKEAEREAAAKKARDEAEAKQRAALEAMRAAQEANDLEQREAAEAALQDAKRADKAATRIESTKTHATGGARAVGLRTSYAPVLTDATEAARHYWLTRRADMEAFLLDQARKDVAAGVRKIPGFDIQEIKGVA